MSNATLCKKISASDLMGNVAKFVRESMEVGDRLKAFGVAGICDAIETGTSQYGEWTRFNGDFQGINYTTGEIYRSEKAHAPEVLASVLKRDLEPLKSGEVKDLKHSTIYPLTSSVEFAFTVDLVRHEDSENGAVSYEYITTPKTEIAPNDKIAHLSALLLPEPEAEKPKLTKSKAK